MAQPTYEQLLQRVADLEAQVRLLTAQLQEVLRANKRQAAPFSKGPPKDPPATPGRKPGQDYGPKAHRPIPRQKPDEVIDVPLPGSCPDCGGQTTEDHQAHQVQTEIPRRPILRRFDIHIGHCRRCGRRIQPRHPLQTSDALGAAASQLGPDAQSAVCCWMPWPYATAGPRATSRPTVKPSPSGDWKADSTGCCIGQRTIRTTNAWPSTWPSIATSCLPS